LFVGNPLQPALKFNQIGMLTYKFGHFRRVTIGVVKPGSFPRRTPHLERHRPSSERFQIRTGLLLEPFEGRLTLNGTRLPEDDFQRLSFMTPCGIDVHRIHIIIGSRHLRMQTRHLRLIGFT